MGLRDKGTVSKRLWRTHLTWEMTSTVDAGKERGGGYIYKRLFWVLTVSLTSEDMKPHIIINCLGGVFAQLKLFHCRKKRIAVDRHRGLWIVLITLL